MNRNEIWAVGILLAVASTGMLFFAVILDLFGSSVAHLAGLLSAFGGFALVMMGEDE